MRSHRLRVRVARVVGVDVEAMVASWCQRVGMVRVGRRGGRADVREER